MPAPPRRPPPAAFQPRFALAMLYLIAFLWVYCFALAAPALWEVLQSTPPGPAQEEAARAVMRDVLRERLWIAAAAALVTTALGIHARLLPGTRGWR